MGSWSAPALRPELPISRPGWKARISATGQEAWEAAAPRIAFDGRQPAGVSISPPFTSTTEMSPLESQCRANRVSASMSVCTIRHSHRQRLPKKYDDDVDNIANARGHAAHGPRGGRSYWYECVGQVGAGERMGAWPAPDKRHAGSRGKGYHVTHEHGKRGTDATAGNSECSWAGGCGRYYVSW